ncbi:hypothetical protein FA13DRAFT_1287481 [Coprinellus micaceus]|uniref:Uncharacterized protein n=1 Tax=Coprinellus micaceus TaxID=71717 RepID=A0A4Y7SSF7_COPMI|nr:hypothetical protein FA13DRAFT_1287481 [Coprinellus micaceus]
MRLTTSDSPRHSLVRICRESVGDQATLQPIPQGTLLIRHERSNRTTFQWGSLNLDFLVLHRDVPADRFPRVTRHRSLPVKVPLLPRLRLRQSSPRLRNYTGLAVDHTPQRNMRLNSVVHLLRLQRPAHLHPHHSTPRVIPHLLDELRIKRAAQKQGAAPSASVWAQVPPPLIPLPPDSTQPTTRTLMGRPFVRRSTTYPVKSYSRIQSASASGVWCRARAPITPPATLLSKHGKHWKVDGNLIVQLDGERYKLYRGRIVQISGWFTDVLANPDP